MVLRVLLLLTAFSLCRCHVNPKKKVYHLVRKTVYEMSDAADTNALKQRKPVYTDTSYIEYIFKGYDLVDVHTLDSTILVKLRYSDTNNFLRRNFYDGLKKAYLTCDAALKLCAAQYFLRQEDSSLCLLVLDAARPLHIQQVMWDSLKMDPVAKLNYLSRPDETSLHNYGCAVDVTIVNSETGEELDMGTDFDVFDKLSQPFYEIRFLRSGDLTQEAYMNRMLLRRVMQRAGLNPITSEWWHFSLCKKQEAAKKYDLIK
jgi:zinc D-Ala-D-Ala dipeptidase